jgi:hypothetical protein
VDQPNANERAGHPEDPCVEQGTLEDHDCGSSLVGPERRDLPEGYLDIYKLAVEMADRISARRALASSFFITAQSALIALVGATSNKHWAFALPGLVLSVTWWLLLRSYRHLNVAKFRVIQAMERQLPASPFQDEWDALRPTSERRWRERYVELGFLERIVPIVFAVIFVVILASTPS